MQSRVGVHLFLKHRLEHPESKLFAFDPDFSKFVSSNVRTLPTGGFFGIWLALQRCVQVTVYGFHFRAGYGIRHHYFNKERPRKGDHAIHDYNLEYEVIKKLAQNNLLTSPAPGGMCLCDYPFPVAAKGYCRVEGCFDCFLE